MTTWTVLLQILPWFAPVLIVAWLCWRSDRRKEVSRHTTLYPHPFRRER